MKPSTNIEPKFTYNPLIEDELTAKSSEKILAENSQVRKILEEANGEGFYEAAQILFNSKKLKQPDVSTFEKVLNANLSNYRELKWMEHINVFGLSANERIKDFRMLFEKTCTEIYLGQSRIELSSWINNVEKGKALFVDCPMGVGKTYSIAKVLGNNPNLSAIVFMPTKKLCRRLAQELKSEIIWNTPEVKLKYTHVPDMEEGEDEDADEFEAIAGWVFRYPREYLENEVYYADGIVPDKPEDNIYVDRPYQGGCIHYDDIVKRYRKNWITKKDVCETCSKQNDCRFIKHDVEAPKARIIITTHAQYDRFCWNEWASFWVKDGDPEKAVPRDLFIVDEDILFSRCYTPIYLEKTELDEFIPIIRKFLSKYEVGEQINQKIYSMFGQISACKDTSFVKPIDSKFHIPDEIRKAWIFSSLSLIRTNPELNPEAELFGNHLDLIEDAITHGVVVQKFPSRHRIYFYNRQSYDLSELPPHVFFDGTMLDEKFLRFKLKGVEFEKKRIEVESIWNFRVWQNANTDISKNKLIIERDKAKKFVSDIIEKLGKNNKYLFLSTKTTKINYLEEFVQGILPPENRVIGHYGNLRGINDAKECNVGFMLGSYLPSDAVEITMALGLTQNSLPPEAITETGDYFWKWDKSIYRRIYTENYKIIEELAKAYRLSEHRQALARVRYLNHDVDFYVLSKDLIKDYEHYAQVVDEHFVEELFPLRETRSDTKYPDFVKYVYDWFKTHKTMKLTDIYKNKKYEISKGPASDHAETMLKKGLLAIAPNRKKIYVLAKPNNPQNGHPIL